MKEMEKNLGKNNLLNMIKRANDDSILPNPSPDPDFDFSKYISGGKEMYKNMMTWDIIEETDIKYEIKATECLWAKVYREKDAGDLGFATVCYADALWAKSAHPNIKFTRTKTLMQGDSHCDHCWEFKR